MVKRGALLFGAILAAIPVLAMPADGTQGQDLLFEAEIEPAQVYVQAQAVYRLRFYQAVDVRELQLGAPMARLADIRALGKMRVYEMLRDGRRYRVHEQSYAVFPFASGTLALTGAYAAGRVAVPAAPSADGRHAVRLEAPPRVLTVLPAAAGVAPWLPARALSLHETWSPLPDAVPLGAALRRTIRIEAAGVDASQLPELYITAPGLTVHAEPAKLANRVAGGLNIASREQTFSLVPRHGGNIVVPELRLYWWNVGTAAPAIATLPARAMHVAVAVIPAAVAAPRPPYLPLAVAAMLGTAVLLIRVSHHDLCAAWRLRHACRSGNARAVRNGLLAWAAKVWPDAPPPTLAALAARLHDPAARRAVSELERSLYGPRPSPCATPSLVAAVRLAKRDTRRYA